MATGSSLTQNYSRSQTFGQNNPGRPPTVDNPARITERHFISHFLLLLRNGCLKDSAKFVVQKGCKWEKDKEENMSLV
ncbi:hypothetical protein TNCV_5063711 [Trichonephila clavipes]|nr:hypothetical protein TNCV_5063711 [Trichonephila clavipes]